MCFTGNAALPAPQDRLSKTRPAHSLSRKGHGQRQAALYRSAFAQTAAASLCGHAYGFQYEAALTQPGRGAGRQTYGSGRLTALCLIFEQQAPGPIISGRRGLPL